MHIIKEAIKVFDKVYVGIGVNKDKIRHFNQEEMKQVINSAIQEENIEDVEVVIYNGLTVECAKEVGATYLIRGIRNGMDYEYEENLALINEEISGLNTLYLRAGSLGVVSSSFVRELMKSNLDIGKYVPNKVREYLEGKK
jgi:pantetheine-phosphate adenylyltransferase